MLPWCSVTCFTSQLVTIRIINSFEASKISWQQCVSSKFVTIETRMPETSGKPCWLEEASREMRSGGLGPHLEASQSKRRSQVVSRNFLLSEKCTSYEPTMDTTSSVQSKGMDYPGISGHWNQPNAQCVGKRTHPNAANTMCAISRNLGYLDTYRLNGPPTRKHTVN